MRSLMMIALLAGTAAVPAVAQDGGRDRREARSESGDDDSRSERRDARRAERQTRSESSDDAPAPRVVAPRAPEPRAVEARDDDTPRVRRDSGDSVRDWRRAERSRPDSPSAVQDANLAPAVDTPEAAAAAGENRRRRLIGDTIRRAPDGRSARDGRVTDRHVPTTPGIGDRRVGRFGRNVPAEGSAPPPPDRAAIERGRTDHNWRRDWRRDGRYDWRRHRDRDRSRFRIGFYFDPFGWNYRRYNIGWRLWPSYYSSSYWLNDPWQYRLPPAYGPYRWIRYHNDALLVNIYTGEVTDVIYDFFW